jgi:DNA helicase-2/ATP-dependent DNA helicase PcrA
MYGYTNIREIFMQLSSKELQNEKKNLENTIALIKSRIDIITDVLSKSKDDIKESNKNLWDETSNSLDNFDVIVEFNQYMLDHQNLERKHELYKNILSILEKLLYSPYFARIDFKTDDSPDADKIYIGISTFIDENTEDMIVYDWRAPISSLYYDYTPGRAVYSSPAGKQKGEILLKRQFKIENRLLKLAFDTDIKIDDEILQEILSSFSDNKMREIVTSIQKEQNRIIRNDDKKVLIVQGPAGSGKTSIALHRAAYLLYKNRKSISSDNILIFSPNDIFTDYISDVLPSLGEKNPVTHSFYSFAKKYVYGNYHIEGPYEYMEKLFSNENSKNLLIRNDAALLKNSMDFKIIIDNYIDKLNKEPLEFKTIAFDNITLAKKTDIEDLFYITYKNLTYGEKRRHIRKRLLMVAERLKKELARKKANEMKKEDTLLLTSTISINRHAIKKTMKTIQILEEHIKRMTRYNLYELYYNLFNNISHFKKLDIIESFKTDIKSVLEYTKENIKNKYMPYEDLAPFLYFKSRLESIKKSLNIKHIIIDEGQDFSVFHFGFLKNIFKNSSVTILSDLNQSIHPYINLKSYDNLKNVYKKDDILEITLNKSYRTTKEILSLTSKISKTGESIDSIARHGEEPLLKAFSEDDKLSQAVINTIKGFSEEGYLSVAVICKSEAESKKLYENIKDKINIKLTEKNDDTFEKGFIIIPSYLSKGLEFDCVIIYNASDNNYNADSLSDRRLLYTICTRAKHRLHIYANNKLTGIIG